MKVGTDSVLLGAWSDVKDAKNLLDAGTGCGIIALMAAQRSEGFIDAVEIDEKSFDECKLNFNNSPWADRLKVFNIDYNQFCNETANKYDVILCNPPYFKYSLLSVNQSRNKARHQSTLTIRSLISGATKLLRNNGHLDMIIPFEQLDEVEKICDEHSFFIQRKLLVSPVLNKPASRVLIQTGLKQTEMQTGKICIEKYRRGDYCEEYKNLTREFYIHF